MNNDKTRGPGVQTSMAEAIKNSWLEKREFPRIKANCPVRYQLDSDDTWYEGTLIDYSAMGVQMICDDLIMKGTKVKIEVMPGSMKNIPAIKAEGVIIRHEIDENHHFHIGCQFSKIVRSLA
jgi:hypothetical protein